MVKKANKYHQLMLAKLNVLQVRDIRRSETGGTQSCGVRGNALDTGRGGKRDLGSEGIMVGSGWGPESCWACMGIVEIPAAP